MLIPVRERVSLLPNVAPLALNIPGTLPATVANPGCLHDRLLELIFLRFDPLLPPICTVVEASSETSNSSTSTTTDAISVSCQL